MPPSKLRGVSNAPSGFGSKHRIIRDEDEHWLNKGWEYLLPATNLPARWSKCILGEVVWAICVEETNLESGVYWFERRKDHHFRRQSIASEREARHRRSGLRLLVGEAMLHPTEEDIGNAVIAAYGQLWSVEKPMVDLTYEVRNLLFDGNDFTGDFLHFTTETHSIEELFEDTVWPICTWRFKFSGKLVGPRNAIELADCHYVNDGIDDTGANFKHQHLVASSVFESYDLQEYVDDEGITNAEFWQKVKVGHNLKNEKV